MFPIYSSEWREWKRTSVTMKTRLVSNGKQYSSSNLSPYPLLQFLDLILECLSSLRLKIFQFKLELFDLTFGWLASSLWIAEAILALTEFLLHTGRLDKKKKLINFTDHTQERSLYNGYHTRSSFGNSDFEKIPSDWFLNCLISLPLN